MHCSVKFRLDENADIIWYNDVVYGQELSSPNASSATGDTSNGGAGQGDVFNELAAILLACESFDIVTGSGPETVLSFSTYAGQVIDFKTPCSCPGDTMLLNCDGLYRITCKRVKEGEAIDQAGSFSLICALQEGYFTDVIIKSCDGLYVSLVVNLSGVHSTLTTFSLSSSSKRIP